MSYSIIKKLLFRFPPEIAHNLVKSFTPILPTPYWKSTNQVKSPVLRAEIGSTRLPNPIGLAAGFDKNGEMIRFLDAMGFGFIELGSVTAFPCKGNPKPRIFRLPEDQSLINRMGLPNGGADSFVKNATRFKNPPRYGVNISKTPDFAQKTLISGIDDYLITFTKVYFLGQYTVLNLSCPNSGEAKTFEDPTLFVDLAKIISSEKKNLGSKKPLLIKLSPHLEPAKLKKIIEIAIKHDFDGFVLTNTSPQRENLTTNQKRILDIGSGGLSGAAISHLSTNQIKRVYDIVGDKKIIVGVGGVMSIQDVLDKFSAGAQLIETYTGFIYGGPNFVGQLNKQLLAYCKAHGLKNYRELIGQQNLKWEQSMLKLPA